MPPRLRRLLLVLVRRLDAISARMASGEMDAREFEQEVGRELAAATQAAYREAARQEPDEGVMARLGSLLGAQLGYLAAFAAAIAASGWSPAYAARLRMYGGSIKMIWWMGDARRGARSIPYPAYPAQGTECLTNCGCWWETVTLDGNGNFDCYWRRGKDDSCSTCYEREGLYSPFKVRGWEAA